MGAGARSGSVARLCSAGEHRFAAEIARRGAREGRRVLPGGEYLYAAGAPVDTVWVIEHGLVALRTEGRSRHILALLRDGDLCGDVPLITAAPAACDAVALNETSVTGLSAGEFWQMIDASADLARSWMSHAAARLAAYQARVGDLQAGDIAAMVASLLLHEFGAADQTALTQQTIADLLGVRRGSINRALRRLEDRGIVSGGYGCLRLQDRDRLARLARGEPAGSTAEPQ
jgi:CRP-like cAMP-binding protein